jgi:hypothetical protein
MSTTLLVEPTNAPPAKTALLLMKLIAPAVRTLASSTYTAPARGMHKKITQTRRC